MIQQNIIQETDLYHKSMPKLKINQQLYLEFLLEKMLAIGF